MFSGRLNDALRQQWAVDGYFIVKDVLTANQTKSLGEEVDRLYAQHLAKNPDRERKQGAELHNVVGEGGPFIELIDLPTTFAMVVELLGPYIQLGLCNATVRPPNPDGKGFIHTDGGPALQKIHVSDDSWALQLKVHYFLTDTSKPGRGNFSVVPGSHHRFAPWQLGTEMPHAEVRDAVQLEMEPGDAAFFSHALWHGAIGNASDITRKTVTYGYNQLFFRCMDYRTASTALLEQCSPRQRRLLGDMGPDPNPVPITPGDYRFFYTPADQVDVIEGRV